MKLKSNFSSGLDFKPLDFWPDTLPAIALGEDLLCGFNLAADHPVFAHANSENNLKILKSVYPQLTLPELARLYKSPAFLKYFAPDQLLKTYGFHFSPETQDVLELLFELPEGFQNFISQKKFSPQELSALLDLSLEQRVFVTQEILKAEESKQDSAKRLELLSDLIQMGMSTDSLENKKLSALQQFRYPITTERDQALSQTNLPWLSQIKTQFKRKGDKAGFEIQFFAGTPAELNKLAQNLSKVASEWNSK